MAASLLVLFFVLLLFRPRLAFIALAVAIVLFYRGRTSSLRTLKGSRVARGGKDMGALRDVVVSAEGVIESFVVQSADGTENIPVGPEVALDGNGHNGSG